MADPAPRCSIWVREVASRTHTHHISFKILTACLTIRRIENSKFRLGATHGSAERSKSEQRTHEIIERVEVVDPISPEWLDLSIWDENPAERDESSDDYRVGERGEDGVGGVGGDELANAGVDELVHEHYEEGCAGFVGIGWEADGIIPRRYQ